MAESTIKLALPTQYDMISNSTGDRCAEPISGTVILTGYGKEKLSNLRHIHIALVCVIESKLSRKDTKKNKRISCWLNRWKTKGLNSPGTDSSTRQSCSVVEPLTLSQTFNCIRTENGHNIHFYLPVSANIPPTSELDIGNIRFHMTAKLETMSGEILSDFTSREINIARKTWPGQPSIEHIRRYSSVLNQVTKIVLVQDLESDMKSKVLACAKVSVQPPRPAGRRFEYHCVAIRGLRWRLEEVTQVHSRSNSEDASCQNSEPFEDQLSIRVICKGRKKGYWALMQNPANQKCLLGYEDQPVHIPFEIKLPRNMSTACDVDLSCYSSFSKPTDALDSVKCSLQQTALCSARDSVISRILITHQLKVDVLTCEDTFDIERAKHTLVERKSLQALRDVSFPIQIIDRATANVDEMRRMSSLPLYEELSTSLLD